MSYRSIKCSQASCSIDFLVYEYFAAASINDEAGMIMWPYCHQTDSGESAVKYVAAGLEKPFLESVIKEFAI